MNYRIERKRTDHSIGFPVVIRHAPKVVYEERDMEALDVAPGELTERVVRKLAAVPFPWTGNQVRAVRLWFDDPLRDLADRLGVSHVAVKNWQDAADAPTNMAKGTEYMLRMDAARKLLENEVIDEREFVELSARAAAFDPDREPEPLEIDGLKLVDDDWGDDVDRNSAATG